jgi:hypothetical protein
MHIEQIESPKATTQDKQRMVYLLYRAVYEAEQCHHEQSREPDLQKRLAMPDRGPGTARALETFADVCIQYCEGEPLFSFARIALSQICERVEHVYPSYLRLVEEFLDNLEVSEDVTDRAWDRFQRETNYSLEKQNLGVPHIYEAVCSYFLRREKTLM